MATYPVRPLAEHPVGGIGLGGLLSPTWDTGALYLQCAHPGYIPRLGIESPSLRTVIAEIKSYAGLGITTFLFDPRGKAELSFGIGSDTLKQQLIIYQMLDGIWTHIEPLDLPLNTFELLSSIKTRKTKGISNFDKHSISLIKVAFKHGQKSRKLQLCSEWLFDSYPSDSDLLTFVQAMVSLEILFGDRKQSDVVGIGKLLANRCAYLVGNGFTEREKILADFDKIYEVRSNIIHSGKTYLTGREWELFNVLRWMCRRAIQKGIELLRKEPSSSRDE